MAIKIEDIKNSADLKEGIAHTQKLSTKFNDELGKGNKIKFNENKGEAYIITPDGKQRERVETELGSTFFKKDDAGQLVPHYEVVLEKFEQTEHDFDITTTFEKRNLGHGDKLIRQNDKLTGFTQGGGLTTAEDVDGGTALKTRIDTEMRVWTIINDLEFSTSKSLIDLKDNRKKSIAFELKAEDLKNHTRSRRVRRNAIALQRIITSSNLLATLPFDDTITGAGRKVELINLGAEVDALFKTTLTLLEEIMTDEKIDGWRASEILGGVSPLVQEAWKEYLISISTGSDLAYKDLTSVNGYDFEVRGVKFWKSNFLKDSQSLIVPTNAGPTQTLYENDDRVEFIMYLPKYLLLTESTPKVVSKGTLNANGVIEDEVVSQYIEGVESVHSRSIAGDLSTHYTISVERVSLNPPPLSTKKKSLWKLDQLNNSSIYKNGMKSIVGVREQAGVKAQKEIDDKSILQLLKDNINIIKPVVKAPVVKAPVVKAPVVVTQPPAQTQQVVKKVDPVVKKPPTENQGGGNK